MISPLETEAVSYLSITVAWDIKSASDFKLILAKKPPPPLTGPHLQCRKLKVSSKVT